MGMVAGSYDNHSELRHQAFMKIYAWFPHNENYTWPEHYLAKVFGFKDYNQLMNAQRRDPNINKTMRAICGPNGYAIYKTLVARNIK